ncbi:MAG: ChaN family lipoprotein [Spartobacteria bacterium]
MKWWLLLAAVLTSGCGTLGKPPLPKFATGEAPRPALPASQKMAAPIRRADVIYFGLTSKSAAESAPAWRIVGTLQESGGRVALGWSELPVGRQPLLDQWQRQEISAQQLVDQLGVAQRSDWMERALRPGVAQVALGAPRELLRKLRAGDALTEEERAALPTNFRPRAEAFDNFVDRVSTSSRLRRYNIDHLYRAHLAAEQSIAENIVRFVQENPGTKLLVFLPDDAMINPREVADYVAQKAPLQQMILDRPERSPNERPQLLARRRSGPLEIVDRTPKTRGHDRRFSAPRLGAARVSLFLLPAPKKVARV